MSAEFDENGEQKTIYQSNITELGEKQKVCHFYFSISSHPMLTSFNEMFIDRHVIYVLAASYQINIPQCFNGRKQQSFLQTVSLTRA